ncbi:D-alanine--D-alanine ligase family protein [Tessaracoccus antarcticus]|uniref:D-alanine--D-alanine ligase n=1 Tax=Tessaracoccus antarcticus TaxID=2479848 RepID=A0A3M0G987_9ACTN|nr:D-alanine--D-alanine ligase [Tessaracoccus antarcticus]RMB61495.1 D-alanine--D-alanine ligase [Tessaracoccus antarcticus]
MTVIVISGGLSHERDVSLRSGRRVTQALRSRGHQVVETDVGTDLVPLVRSTKDPVVIPMLHGGLGEDGALREVLGLLGVPFVGPTGAASRLTFDKSIATRVVANAGLSVTRQVALPHDIFRELGAPALMQAIGDQIGYPLMVKPSRSGSALGALKVADQESLATALVGAYAYGPVAVVERFIEGTELAVTVLEGDNGLRALPPVEIRPTSGIYDYEARYTAGATRFVTPAELPPETLRAAQELAVAAHEALGLRHLSRTDMVVAADGTPIFLEGNVAPGMTETSLAPLAFEAAGMELGEVFSSLVERARGDR